MPPDYTKSVRLQKCPISLIDNNYHLAVTNG